MINYETFTLANGLKVVVHEDHAIPKAVVNILYRVGSKDEDPERTGFAHLFEHLMFKGSKNIPSYDTPLQQVGGSNNAFTSADVTNYYISLPSNQLETAFWLESDRMLGLDFSEEKLEAEKSVVIEEYKQRYLNQPYGDAHLKLRPLHYHTHPYQWMPIGKDMDHIAEASMEDVQGFFYRFYAPNNATLIVAGDVEPAQVRQLAEKWFGEISSRELGKKPLPQELAQTEARELSVKGKVPYPAVYKMYHIGPYGSREYFVADLLTDFLARGKSSLFFQELVKKRQLSPSVNAYVLPMHDPSSMVIVGQVGEGHTTEDFEKGLQETLDLVQDLTEADLERIKAKVEASFVMRQTTLLNKAISLAMFDAIGDMDMANRIPEIYQSIALEEIKTLAGQALDPNRCSTLYYLPE
jgi:zinc protease